MKKVALLLTIVVLAVAFQTKSVYAVSTGYERFQDDECEILLEYFPIVPYDSLYPTASEEFAIKFFIWQNSYWTVPLLEKRFPRGFEIKVYYRDDSCNWSDYVTWKRWYPVSESQYGLPITWTLGGGYGPLQLSATVEGGSVFGYDRNYDKYNETFGGKTYRHVGDLSTTYRSWYMWGPTEVYGGGSIGIPNDAAQCHQGHHVLIWVHVHLWWLDYDWWQHFEHHRHFDFVLGDDIPGDTDCWLTLEQGNVGFTTHNPSEPVCAMKTKTDGYFYIPNTATDLLKVEMLFDNQNLTGDQTSGIPPYSSINNYPDTLVDIRDIGFISRKNGLVEGDSDWDYMADVVPDRLVDIRDISAASRNFGKTGTYITDLSGVTITFNTSEEISPDDDGFVTIPQDATWFTVKRYGNPIGAMVIFW